MKNVLAIEMVYSFSTPVRQLVYLGTTTFSFEILNYLTVRGGRAISLMSVQLCIAHGICFLNGFVLMSVSNSFEIIKLTDNFG